MAAGSPTIETALKVDRLVEGRAEPLSGRQAPCRGESNGDDEPESIANRAALGVPHPQLRRERERSRAGRIAKAGGRIKGERRVVSSGAAIVIMSRIRPRIAASQAQLRLILAVFS